VLRVVGVLFITVSVIGVFQSFPDATGRFECSGSAIGDFLAGSHRTYQYGLTRCREEAAIQVVAASFLLSLGVLLLFVPRLSSLYHRWSAPSGVDGGRTTGVWRPGPASRIAAWGAVVIPPFVSLIGIGATRTGGWVVGGVFSSFMSAFVYVVALRPRVEIRPEELVIVNSFTTVRTTWDQISEISEPGYWGTRVGLRDGRSVVVKAGQKSNWAAALGKRTYADELAAELTAHASGERTLTPDQVAAAAARREGAKKPARVSIAVGVGFLLVGILIRAFIH
jgi:hypothetical protein